MHSFTRDERKRRLNLRKHGIDFLDVGRVFAGLAFTAEDDSSDLDPQGDEK